MIYSVDYLLPNNKEAFEAEKRSLPMLVVADTFDDAYKAAKKFESENAVLYEVKLNASHNAIVVARGYSGLAAPKSA